MIMSQKSDLGVP